MKGHVLSLIDRNVTAHKMTEINQNQTMLSLTLVEIQVTVT